VKLDCDRIGCTAKAVYFAEIWFDRSKPTYFKFCVEHLLIQDIPGHKMPKIDINFFDGDIQVTAITEEEYVLRTVMNT